VSHDRLWAPWRLGYIQGKDPPAAPEREVEWLPGADPQCFLCCGAAGGDDRANLVVARGEHTLVVLNRYPYNNGHLLVAPLAHLPTLAELTPDLQLELMETLTRYTELLRERMSAEGFNIGLNLGRVAGAGVPGHLHWHIVPRWSGDTNFMPVIADLRVIPQSLDALWELLAESADTTAKQNRTTN
jgi:ATP adenylyltransferase